MPDPLKVSMMSFRTQDGRSHPGLGGMGEIFLVTSGV